MHNEPGYYAIGKLHSKYIINIVYLFNFLGFHGERYLDIECFSGVASKVDRYGLLLEFLLSYKVRSIIPSTTFGSFSD